MSRETRTESSVEVFRVKKLYPVTPTRTVSENLSTPSQIVQMSLQQLFHVSHFNPSGIVLTAFIPIVEGQRPDLSLDHFLKLKLSEKNSRLNNQQSDRRLFSPNYYVVYIIV
jgi:hypothetical protein